MNHSIMNGEKIQRNLFKAMSCHGMVLYLNLAFKEYDVTMFSC